MQPSVDSRHNRSPSPYRRPKAAIGASRLFQTDEELGKRDDDHKPSKYGLWPFKRKVLVRKRRILALIVGCFLVWAFIQNIPTDLKPARERFGNYPSFRPGSAPAPKSPSNVPGHYEDDDSASSASSQSRLGEDQEREPQHNYNGDIKFFPLGRSLHDFMRHRTYKENIVFAGSDLKSFITLIPLACEMQKWNRNNVHIAIMGRDDIPIQDIQELNGATSAACPIYWHDGRPDQGPISSDSRMEQSVAGALLHMKTYLTPKALIIKGSDVEDYFFTSGMRRRARELNLPLIEIPGARSDSLSWLTRLDSDSLASWHTASIEILVHAQEGSSGSLIRLLNSLRFADHSGFSLPRLTIELPTKVDEAARQFLESFNWPPFSDDDKVQNSQVILRRRIDGTRLNSEQASTRFIESFYPVHPHTSHVLLLSPQAELSPLYFQYLKYLLLEYKYSTHSRNNNSQLFGIGLEIPSSHLNGSADFTVPPPKASTNSGAAKPSDSLLSPFLWQAPNTNAALYFGDKWLEIHSYLSNRHAVAQEPLINTRLQNRDRFMAAKHPTWAELFLEYMRLRGYSLLYPSLPSPESSKSSESSDAFVTVHTDLYIPPEEFIPVPPPKLSSPLDPGSAPPVLTVPTDYLSKNKLSDPTSKVHMTEPSLLRSLAHHLSGPPDPNDRPPKLRPASPIDDYGGYEFGDEYDDKDDDDEIPVVLLSEMPSLDHLGTSQQPEQLEKTADSVAAEFRRSIGGCDDQPVDSKTKKKQKKVKRPEDLFCFGDQEKDENDDGDEDEDGNEEKDQAKEGADANVIHIVKGMASS